MTVNNRTSSRDYAKPNVANLLSEDVVRLSEALDSIDTDVAALQSRAPLASPALTGTPSAPTPAVDTNTTQVATTAFVVGQASAANPVINGTAAAGSSLRFARADHVHPTDTSRAPVESPTFEGTPEAPTAAADTDTTQLATTAFVVGQDYTKQTRTVFAGAGLTGGGDLSANRTIAADFATQAEAEAGTSSIKLMTPERVSQAITSDLATQAEAVAGASSTKLMTPERVSQALLSLPAYIITVTNISKTLVNRERCTVTFIGRTLTLPASPLPGFEVAVTVAGNFMNTIIARNGQKIMGLAEDFTINSANTTVTLFYINATVGWRII